MRLLIDRLPSPIGNNFVVWDEQERVCAMEFENYESRMQSLLQKHYGAVDLNAGTLPTNISEKLEAYFNGDLASLDTITVATGGTAFQRDAWSALRRIPAGTTVSYGYQAAMIGRPKASRAVGAANGANVIAMIIPCHRVIGSTGKLTGYGGGIERKRWLIAHERRYAG